MACTGRFGRVHASLAKTLTKIYFDARQNHLIPTGFIRAYLIPFLFDKEKATANLLDQERKGKKSSIRDEGRKTKKMKLFESDGIQEPGKGEASKEKKKKKEAGRKHGGLRVVVYMEASMWKVYMMMSRWEFSNGTILKDDEYSRYLARCSGVKVGDKMELWGFGKEDREALLRSP